MLSPLLVQLVAKQHHAAWEERESRGSGFANLLPSYFLSVSRCPLTFAAEVAVFVVDPLDVSDDPLVTTIFTLSRDAVGLLKLFRTGEATQEIHFALDKNSTVKSLVIQLRKLIAQHMRFNQIQKKVTSYYTITAW